jgi:hypothetical protein
MATTWQLEPFFFFFVMRAAALNESTVLGFKISETLESTTA